MSIWRSRALYCCARLLRVATDCASVPKLLSAEVVSACAFETRS